MTATWHKSSSRRGRAGVTIVDVLIAVTIIGLLIALLMPAVQAAREAARRTRCANNLHQLGIALQSYHANIGSLPPAAIWSPIGEPLGAGVLPIGLIDRVARYGSIQDDTIHENWLIMLLPFLDLTSLHERFDSTIPISAERNRQGRESFVPTLVCPSDPWSDVDKMYLRGSAVGLNTNRYARGNYAINIGPDKNCIEGLPFHQPCVGGFLVKGADLLHNNEAIWGNGIAGANRSIRFADVTDGLSHTVALDEIRAGLDAVDPRGAWALGQVGASAVARHGLASDVAGPNACRHPGEEFIGCTRLGQRLGESALGCMRCAEIGTSNEINAQATSRSMHVQGVNVLFCDASVHFESNAIDLRAWHSLHTRSQQGLVGAEP